MRRIIEISRTLSLHSCSVAHPVFRTFGILAGAAMLFSSPVAAQVVMEPQNIESMSTDVDEQIEKALKRRIQISPSIVAVDARTRTVVVEFYNESQDTLDAKVSIKTSQPEIAIAQSDSASRESVLLVGAGNTEWSMTSWVKDAPQNMRLAPGERKRVTLKIDVPTDPKAGTYTAWIVTYTKSEDAEKDLNSTDKEKGEKTKKVRGLIGPDGKPPVLTSSAKITYTTNSK